MLQDWYNEFNSRFFQGRLPPDVEVRFATSEDDKDQLGRESMACYVHASRVILHDPHLRDYWKVLKMNLIHEMVHALLPDHVSHEETEDHGMVFHHQIVKLFELGAYDGIL